VTVVGAGASAVGLAALLHEAGASARLIARVPDLKFSRGPAAGPPSLWRRLRHPPSGIGSGWKSRMMTDVPHLFRRLPDPFRVDVVRKHLGPSSAWYLKDRVVGRVDLALGTTVAGAQACGGRLKLKLETAGASRWIETDHVIAATGFRSNVDRLPFLSETLLDRIERVGEMPSLSPYFESSVQGLHFLGPLAANSFGPMMRFMYGADYAARRLAPRLTGARP